MISAIFWITVGFAYFFGVLITFGFTNAAREGDNDPIACIFVCIVSVLWFIALPIATLMMLPGFCYLSKLIVNVVDLGEYLYLKGRNMPSRRGVD